MTEMTLREVCLSIGVSRRAVQGYDTGHISARNTLIHNNCLARYLAKLKVGVYLHVDYYLVIGEMLVTPSPVRDLELIIIKEDVR